MKLLEQNNFKMLLLKNVDLELRLFRNDGANSAFDQIFFCDVNCYFTACVIDIQHRAIHFIVIAEGHIT